MTITGLPEPSASKIVVNCRLDYRRLTISNELGPLRLEWTVADHWATTICQNRWATLPSGVFTINAAMALRSITGPIILLAINP
jgi:hypothetical protein